MSDQRDPDTKRETTIIQTGERSGGGAGAIVGVVALLVVAVLAFLFFGGYFGRSIDKSDINVNVAAPNIELPDVQVTPPSSEPSNKSGN